MTFSVRSALPGDIPVLLHFIRALAEYEHAADSVVATEETLEASLFKDKPDAYAVIVKSNEGVAAGFALYFYSYSTWRAQRGLFLEDLFVLPEYRGQGLGRSLLATLADLACQQQCARFEWNVLNWNTPAIKVYRAAGAQPQSEWTTWRVEGERLQALAARATLPWAEADGSPSV